MNRLRFQRPAEGRPVLSRMRLVSVLSGKGGVGKTVIAFNLAEQMASLGYRVLLVDGDANFGNLHILANTACDYGLHEFIQGQLSLQDAIVSLNSNLDLLASLRNGPPVDPNNTDGATGLAAKLRDESSPYDFAIIDHSSGVSEATTAVAHSSDVNLLVLVPELTAIADCFGLYKQLFKANPEIPCCLLINRVESDEEAEYIRTKFGALAESFIGARPRYLGCLPEDEAVRRSVAAQVPLSQLGVESAALRAIAGLAGALAVELRESRRTAEFGREKRINRSAATADMRE